MYHPHPSGYTRGNVANFDWTIPLPVPPGFGTHEWRCANGVKLLQEFFRARPRSLLLGVFRSFDVDGNGTVGFDEFGRGLRALNVDLSEEDLRRVFDSFDTITDDDKLQAVEFINKMIEEPDFHLTRFQQSGIGHTFLQGNEEATILRTNVYPTAASGYSNGCYPVEETHPMQSSGVNSGMKADLNAIFSQSSTVIGAAVPSESEIDANATEAASEYIKVYGA